MGRFGRVHGPRRRPLPQQHQTGRTQKSRAEGYAGAIQPAGAFLVVTALARPGMLTEVNVIASMPKRPVAIKCRGLTENGTLAPSGRRVSESKTARFADFAISASHSVHPVGVSQHVHAHQPKYDEHNHGGHDPHDAHVGFFSVLFILVWHPVLPNVFSAVAVALLRTGATLREIYSFPLTSTLRNTSFSKVSFWSSTLRHFDAAEWAPFTASKTERLRLSKYPQYRAIVLGGIPPSDPLFRRSPGSRSGNGGSLHCGISIRPMSAQGSIATELAKATLPLMSAMAPIATELMRHNEPSLSAICGLSALVTAPRCAQTLHKLARSM
jgi:hypothetical protein